MPEKLSKSIESFLDSREPEPELVFRLSVRYPAFTLPSFLLLGSLAWVTYPLAGSIIAWTGVLIAAALLERRRVCRIEIAPHGMTCYGVTGRKYLEIDRATVESVDLDESVDSKDYTVIARGRRHLVPHIYDGYHKIIAVLENWAQENRNGP